MDDADDTGWGRSDWARWWLDHDDVDEAARVLEPGDVVAGLGRSDFFDLAAALARRGLTAIYEDRAAFVYTPEDARDVQGGTRLEDLAAERRPPARLSPGVPLANKRSA